LVRAEKDARLNESSAVLHSHLVTRSHFQTRVFADGSADSFPSVALFQRHCILLI
jgi:hypothetical protein